MKIQKKKLGWGREGEGSGLGGQGGCERRIEVFVKIQKKKFLRGGGGGGGGRWGVGVGLGGHRVDVNKVFVKIKKKKKLAGSGWGGGGSGWM